MLILALGLVGIVAFTRWAYHQPWTGLDQYIPASEKEQRAKTLWDWMDLLIVPVVLGAGAYWFNSRRDEAVQAVEHDRQRQESLNSFIESVGSLLIEHPLRPRAIASSQEVPPERRQWLSALVDAQ